jgi:hypothetical protein
VTTQAEQPPEEELYCFINADRECGPECMAFSSVPAESPHLSMRQRSCTLLVGVERAGRYMGGLVQLVRSAQQDEKTKQQDAARIAAAAGTGTKP